MMPTQQPERRPRRYRSIQKEVRATYATPGTYGADVAGLPRPPVRHRSKYKLWRW